MFRKGLVLAALCLIPAVANAQARGPFELTLSGTATNGSRFNGVTAAANGGLGYFINDNLELSLRQSVSYTDIGVGSAWNGSTTIAADLHFPLGDQGQFQPFVGANVGYVYGESVHDTFAGGPEAGLKVFVNNSTFIYGLVQYQIFFDRHSSSKAFSDGQFVYGLGIGFRF